MAAGLLALAHVSATGLRLTELVAVAEETETTAIAAMARTASASPARLAYSFRRADDPAPPSGMHAPAVR